MTIATNPYFQHLTPAERQNLAGLDEIGPFDLLDEIDLLRIVTARALKHIYDLRALDPKRCFMHEIEIIRRTIPAILRILNTVIYIARHQQEIQEPPPPAAGEEPFVSIRSAQPRCAPPAKCAAPPRCVALDSPLHLPAKRPRPPSALHLPTSPPPIPSGIIIPRKRTRANPKTIRSGHARL
jgi:hypothetical protein